MLVLYEYLVRKKQKLDKSETWERKQNGHEDFGWRNRISGSRGMRMYHMAEHAERRSMSVGN